MDTGERKGGGGGGGGGGGVRQPSMMILRCFGHFLVFHAKTAWAHVGFMK